jgi:DNA-binding NarL/FixJ family response regulator
MLCPEDRSSKSNETTLKPDPSKSQEVRLGAIWSELRAGRMKITSSLCSAERCYLTLRLADPDRPELAHAREQLWLLERVLLGEQQKALAIDLAMSPSTVALILRRCLRALGVDCRFQRVPLLLVMAAQASGQQQRRLMGRLAVSHTGRGLVVSAARPDSVLSGLLGSEAAAVTRMWLEGKSYREIAEIRGRSSHTVSNQLATTYGKLGVSGRVELVGCLMSRSAAVAGAAH